MYEVIETLILAILVVLSIVGTIAIALQIRIEKTPEKGKYNLVYIWESRKFVRQFSIKLNLKRKN